jgi:outer membrane protein
MRIRMRFTEPRRRLDVGRVVSAAALAVLVVLCVMGEDAAAQRSTLRLTPERAVALALEHDLELKRDQFGPQIAEADVRAARTAWTPELSTHVFRGRSEAPRTSAIDGGEVLTDRRLSSDVGLSQRLPWGGSYRLGWDAARQTSNSVFTRFQPELRASVAATFEQPLLRGLTFDAARAERAISLQARELADTDLTAARASTTREVLHAYWAWVYARDFLAVQRQSLEMAQALLDGNRARVTMGAIAKVDVIEAEAEVARRAEIILIAEKNVANADERLRFHIFDPLAPGSDVELEPEAPATERPITADARKRALAERYDLKALQTSMAIDTINIRRFRNDALPEASVRVNYGVSGAGGTELLRAGGFPGSVIGTDARNFSSVLDDLTRRRYPSWSLELAITYPLGTARAEADAARVSVQRRQREAALRAAEQRVIVEVNAAVREVDTNYRRLDTSATAVSLAERRLDAEQRKFASGLSTSFFVFQAQRDLSEAREAQLRSLLDYHLATVDVEAVQVIPLDRR